MLEFPYRSVLFDDQLTPYMHVLINHVPEFGEKYGSLSAFEMEDIEYLNYENKLIFFGASNKLSRNTYTSEQVRFFGNLSKIYFTIIIMYKMVSKFVISDSSYFQQAFSCFKTSFT